MDRNYRGIDGNCMELIWGSHPPYIYIYRERERERCTNALQSWFILQLISNLDHENYQFLWIISKPCMGNRSFQLSRIRITLICISSSKILHQDKFSLAKNISWSSNINLIFSNQNYWRISLFGIRRIKIIQTFHCLVSAL